MRFAEYNHQEFDLTPFDPHTALNHSQRLSRNDLLYGCTYPHLPGNLIERTAQRHIDRSEQHKRHQESHRRTPPRLEQLGEAPRQCSCNGRIRFLLREFLSLKHCDIDTLESSGDERHGPDHHNRYQVGEKKQRCTSGN